VAEQQSDQELVRQAGERARLLAAALTEDADALRAQHPDGAERSIKAARDAAVLAELLQGALDRHGEPPPETPTDESDPS
jgi:hypothetical protein